MLVAQDPLLALLQKVEVVEVLALVVIEVLPTLFRVVQDFIHAVIQQCLEVVRVASLRHHWPNDNLIEQFIT